MIAELRASETYCVFQLQHQATSDDARAGQGSAPAAMVDVGVLEASKNIRRRRQHHVIDRNSEGPRTALHRRRTMVDHDGVARSYMLWLR